MPYLNLFLSSENDHIEHTCELLRKEIGLKRKEQTKALKLLLCNLKIYPSKEVFVERRKKAIATQRANPLGVGAKAIISSLDALHEHGYIVQEIGRWILNKNTTIISTTKLHTWFEIHQWLNDDIEAINAQHITLRLNESINNKKVFVDYEDTEYSIWLNHELEKYSKLLNNSSIKLLDSSKEVITEYSKLTI